MTDKPTTSSAAEFALQALVAAGHVSQELVDRALALPGAPQPAHSGEPVYAFRRRGQDDFCTCTFKRYTELSDFPEKFEMRIFYTAQPVEREPLTREQVKAICVESGYETATLQERADFINGIRHAERHHGIKKGGQHGTE